MSKGSCNGVSRMIQRCVDNVLERFNIVIGQFQGRVLPRIFQRYFVEGCLKKV